MRSVGLPLRFRLIAYVRLMAFFAGALGGLQLPGLMHHYEAMVDARRAESEVALAAFQDEADRFFKGSIQALADHYRQLPDTIASEGGASIESLLHRRDQLAAISARLSSGWWQAIPELVWPSQVELREQAWNTYSWQIILERQALLAGLIFGLVVAVLSESLLLMILAVPGLLRRAPSGEPR